jgi:O-antigen/teichoic acid export membrane protein
MGVVLRQSALASVWNYLGLALGYLNMLVLFPNILGAEKFGLIRVIISTSMILAQFGELGLSNTVIKYFPHLEDKEKGHHGFFNWILRIGLILSAILIVLLFIFKPVIISQFAKDNSLFTDHYYSIILISVTSVVSEILFGYARAQMKNVPPVFIKEFFLRLLQTAVISAFYLNYFDFDGFILTFAIAYGIQAILIIGYLYYRKLIVLSKQITLNTKVTLKELYRFSGFMVLNKLPNTALNNVDVVMLGAMTNFENAGVYSIALFLANVVAVPARTIHQISIPLLAKYFKNNNIREVEKLYKQSSINQLIICGAIFSLIIGGFDLIISILKFEKIGDLFAVTFLLGLSKLFNVATGINGGIIVQSKYYKWSFIWNVISLITVIGLNFILIPRYQIVGAALGTAISIMILSVMKLIFVKIKIKIQPFNRTTFKTFIILVIIHSIIYYNTIQSTLIKTIVNLTTTLLLIIASIQYWHISNEMKKLFKKVFK